MLENGAASEFAGHFDIDWRPVKPELADKVLLPILLKHKDDGRVKLFAITRALAVRARRAALFADGAYRALDTHGALGESVCAFARTRGEETTLTIVPRLIARRGADGDPLAAAVWGDTGIDVPAELGTRFRNAFTGERVVVRTGTLVAAEVFGVFPIALLEREAA